MRLSKLCAPVTKPPYCTHWSCVSLSVRNNGTVVASTVAQLYLELSIEAGHGGLAPMLKGFVKLRAMPPGGALRVQFALSSRDVSYYEPAARAWARAKGVHVFVGESSADIRQAAPHRFGSGEAA